MPANGDKVIDIVDLVMVGSNFGKSAEPISSGEWTQFAHDPQRTGYTPEEPLEPWTLLWTWNGPDANGGTGGHFYDVGSSQDNGGSSPMWEGGTVMGGNLIFVPALTNGLYALNKNNGQVAWKITPLSGASLRATPAYDPATGNVFVGDSNGIVYKINAVTGQLTGNYNAGNPTNKALMIVGPFVFAVTNNGQLHKIRISDMTKEWIYSGNASIATMPAYSAFKELIIYATNDLYVHAVSNLTGLQKWRVKPTPNTASDYIGFTGGWPVIAEKHGIVFLRMGLYKEPAYFSGLPSGNKFPTTNDETRNLLVQKPNYQNLFALDFDSGNKKFIPAVGLGGVEGTITGGDGYNLKVGAVPVIKTLPDGTEVAYSHFRNGQTADIGYPWGEREDTHLGEMVLDDTVSGYQAGDLRFINWANSYVYLTDEQCPLTMAGDTIFHAHWGASESTKILDRGSSRGSSLNNGITSDPHPVVIRRMQSSNCGSFNSNTHWTTCGLILYNDGRYWDGPGWWTYWNVMDPPTVLRGSEAYGAYSEGILPRYTYVSDGLVIVQGNGGELMVFRHSGSAQPPSPTPTTGFQLGDIINQDGQVNYLDALAVLRAWLSSGSGQYNNREDINHDQRVNGPDFGLVVLDWGS